MQWFYASNGQQAGPVSENELDALAQRGVVAPGTLVWREGMAQWQPYNVARPVVPPRPESVAPPVINQPQCVECQRFFHLDDLLRYENVFVCAGCKPLFFQKLQEGVAVGVGVGVWRSDKLLVMRKEAVLPDRCVKCNALANGQTLPRKLFWHSPYFYLLIPAGLLVYAIVATIVGKRAKIKIGFCSVHQRIRFRDLIIAWLLCVASLAGLVASFIMPSVALGLTSVGMLLAAGVYGIVRLQPVTPKRIDDTFVWLKGVSPEYLATLPPFPGL